ncbi:hypothetical protein, partial [Acinetobacter sp.]|uniref:hypothetical protein n=1 Tax=Acinetobacter sp. TaxID=472 RepID=UPI003CFBF239
MQKSTVGFGWDENGEMVTEGDNAAILTSKDFILNYVMFHLMTAPGEYGPNPRIGLGLLDILGVPNLDEYLYQIQSDINMYFRGLTDLPPYKVTSVVTKTSNTSVLVELTVTGPNMYGQSEVLVDVEKGRIVQKYSYEDEETVVISTTNTQSAAEIG